MFTVFNLLTIVGTALLAAASLGLLLDRTELGTSAGGRALGIVYRRLTASLGWLTWTWIAVAAGVGYAAVVVFDLTNGQYDCAAAGQTSDLIALLQSGRAFWAGANPFLVSDCGTVTAIPYGLSAVLIDAVGSLGGRVGIAAAWGVVAIALLPLTWWAAGPDRRYVTVFVAILPIYFPLVASQIDGASNAIFPVTVLLAILLVPRLGPWADLLAGFLSSARFPTIFPVVAARGPTPRRILGALVAIAGFASSTAVGYLLWGHEFYHVVFEGQVNRRSFSLNLFGVLLDHGLLPTGELVIVVQGALTLAVTAAAFLGGRTPLRAAALSLTGFALLTQFLSFSILVVLLPVALLGARPRWWLWGIAIVGAMNYDLALNVLAWGFGILWPTDLLDLVLTTLLLGLLADLWRRRPEEGLGAGSTPDHAGRRKLPEVESHLVAVDEPEPGVYRPTEDGGVERDARVPA